MPKSRTRTYYCQFEVLAREACVSVCISVGGLLCAGVQRY